MPVMDGPTSVKKMRELGCTCFIVGVTGNVMQEQIDFFKEHGANAVLAKMHMGTITVHKPLDTDVFESIYEPRTPRIIRSIHSIHPMISSGGEGAGMTNGDNADNGGENGGFTGGEGGDNRGVTSNEAVLMEPDGKKGELFGDNLV
ncbi:hypothetical protein B484DRAFT_408981 [Ochromonadaceae sp. CCMP2298]|nr:hypothetical protein B484DRAFT_408981 [Ochromonadaceae sp. CCMP2298]